MKNTYFIYPLELMHEKVVNTLLLLLTLNTTKEPKKSRESSTKIQILVHIHNPENIKTENNENDSN